MNQDLTRRDFLAAMGAATAGMAMLPQILEGADKTGDRPNILWIVSEDNGPFLGCFGDKNARTPNLDKMASEGIVYLNAFAPAPVCAPCRSSMITGMYACSIGTTHMRSTYKVPSLVTKYCKYLQDLGYYCMNPGKTDYNFTGSSGEWDKGGDWSARKPGQPFMLVLNTAITHESCLHGSKVNPDYLKEPLELPPYHPDTPEIRSNWVEYYHQITKMDAHVGTILQKLEKDGLAEDTIVFYYADHAGILPRSKRYLFETGTHAPLIIRFPKKYQHLAPATPGSKVDQLVSYVDFAPTLVSLAGGKVPEHFQGQAFAGPKAAGPREAVYSFRGRMDERIDLMHGVRDKQFHYIRNYMPHRPYGQHLAYLWQMPATRSWEKAYREGKCNEVQSAFWKPKPSEELYDITKDKWEVNNLADKPEFQEVLERMRKMDHEHRMKIRDTSFLPETDMVRRAEGSTIYDMAQSDRKYPIAKIKEAADVASQRDPESVPKLIEWMKDSDPAIRYWAATGCTIRGEKAAEAVSKLQGLLKDKSSCVRVAAAEALCYLGHAEEGLKLLVEECAGEEALFSLNVLYELDKIAEPVIEQVLAKAPKDASYAGRMTQDLMEKWGKADGSEPAPKKRGGGKKQAGNKG